MKQVKKIQVIFFFLFIACSLRAQKADTSARFISYKKRFTLMLASGFNSSPFSFDLKYGKINKVDFIPNPPLVIKPAFSYYGVTLGVGIKLPVNILSTSKYTKTTYFDIGLNFAIKNRLYFDIGFQYYKGFTLLHQGDFDKTGELRNNNGIYPNLNTTETSISMRYFFFKKYNYRAALGILGEHTKSALSPYLYGYFGAYGVGNNQSSIFPFALQDSINTNSKARTISAFEFGAIPGFAGVLRKKWFQGNLLIGIGPLIQSKAFNTGGLNRSFSGLNWRTDMQLNLGIQHSSWFLFLNGDMKFRSIDINKIKFNQSYYDIRLIGGYRFKVKTPKAIQKMEQKKADKRALKAAKAQQ